MKCTITRESFLPHLQKVVNIVCRKAALPILHNIKLEAGGNELKLTANCLDMNIEPKRWYANVNVSEDISKVAVSRGPLVYCVEGVDNGPDLHCLSLKADAKLTSEWDGELLNGVNVVEGEGVRITGTKDAKGLYTSKKEYKEIPEKIRFVPYHTWGNRGENEMRVWLLEKE